MTTFTSLRDADLQPDLLNRTVVALCRASTSFIRSSNKGVDGRDEPGHDD